MKLLKEIRDEDVFSGVVVEDTHHDLDSIAARLVLFDSNDNIALLKNHKHNHHILPGGKMKPGETHINSLRREAWEEAGCAITDIKEIGKIIEYLSQLKLKRESYFYSAKVSDKKRRPSFSKGEKDKGFELFWVSMDKAMDLLKKDRPNSYKGNFIRNRELMVLQELK